MEDSHVFHHSGNVASLADDGLAVDHALPPLGTEYLHLPNHNSKEPAEPIHSSGLRDRLGHVALPAKDTELDAIFAGKASVPSARLLNEDYDRPASMGKYESAVPLEPAWLADREPAASPLENASPDTTAVNELFKRRANSWQVQHDSWADCGNLAPSNVPHSISPDLHELFGGRGHQIAPLQTSVDADNHVAWADEPNIQLNESKSGFW